MCFKKNLCATMWLCVSKNKIYVLLCGYVFQKNYNTLSYLKN